MMAVLIMLTIIRNKLTSMHDSSTLKFFTSAIKSILHFAHCYLLASVWTKNLTAPYSMLWHIRCFQVHISYCRKTYLIQWNNVRHMSLPRCLKEENKMWNLKYFKQTVSLQMNENFGTFVIRNFYVLYFRLEILAFVHYQDFVLFLINKILVCINILTYWLSFKINDFKLWIIPHSICIARI